jgi:UPF0716 protein FxsA
MLLRLVLLFTLVPIVELALLIEIGAQLGTWPAITLVVGTGVAGAALARSQGLRTIMRLRESVASGRFPGDEIISGVLILAGGLLLLTPGLLTDLCGFLVLVPGSRRLIRQALVNAVRRRMPNNLTFSHLNRE